MCDAVLCQVADDYIGLDVLSSQMDVKTSNFRRVPALPIYGCAQPSSKVSRARTVLMYCTDTCSINGFRRYGRQAQTNQRNNALVTQNTRAQQSTS